MCMYEDTYIWESTNKSFKNQIGLADRTGQNVNRWHIWFEFYDGSGMNLNRCDSAKTDQNQWLGRFVKPDQINASVPS